MMKDMHDLLVHNNITYWIDGGTLLGAVRHQGLIPWDDDLDVSIEKKDEIKFLKIIPFLYTLGYEIRKMHFGYKIYPTNGKSINTVFWKYPYFDIFIVVRQHGKIYYLTYHDDEPKREGEYNFVKITEIYPLKEYKFGPLILFGPNDPYPYLETWYGTNWNEIAYKSYDHSNETKMEKNMVLLTEKLRKPALPSKKLENRFIPAV